MRIKTIVIIFITILLTVIIMQNTGKVLFTILFTDVEISKLLMMLFAALTGFVLGWLVGRPKRVIKLGGYNSENNPDKNGPGTLGDEDREYIN